MAASSAGENVRASPRRPSWLARLLFGDRSAQETAERIHREQQMLEDRKLAAELAAEAEEFAEKIIATLTRKGVCYRYTKTERNEVLEKVQEVAFERPFRGDRSVIQLKVDTRRLPRGVGIRELEDPEILRLLSLNVRRNVLAQYTTEGGFWYVIEREYGIGGIPRFISFADALASRPAHLEGERLAFPIGIAANKKVVWRTMREVVNMLVAGSPKGGKSNFANVLLCTLLKHNKPHQLKLMLIDLKGGLEFNFYESLDDYLLWIPKPRRVKGTTRTHETGEDHDPALFDASEQVVEPEADEPEVVLDDRSGERVKAFIQRREEVPAALSWLIGEAERRMAALQKARCKKIEQYNQRFSFSPMPEIVLVIDEWADIKLTPRIGARAEERLINISNRARAVGIHTILCTQSPNRDVLSIRVKNAMNTKMVFRCADQYMSVGLLGDYSATTLSPSGRAFLIDDGRVEVQTPYITNEEVTAIVEAAATGKVKEIAKPSRHNVTPREVFEWALKKNDGKLSWREIYAEFAPRKLTSHEAKRFGRDYAGQVVTVFGRQYRVEPAVGMPTPKSARLLPVDAGNTETEPAPPNGRYHGNGKVPAGATNGFSDGDTVHGATVQPHAAHTQAHIAHTNGREGADTDEGETGIEHV